MFNRLLKKKILAGVCIMSMLAMCACGQGTTAVDPDTAKEDTEVTVEETTKEPTVEEETPASEDSQEEVKEEEVLEEVLEEEAVEDVQKEVSYEPGPLADNSVEFASNMKLGWNLGNTLDAKDGSGLGTETSWGQPLTNKEMIFYVKEAGFTTIRIPTTWHKHMKDGVIDEEWMNRVQEVVDWALEAGLYVILNSHHDNSAYYPTEEHMAESKQFITDVWSQVADHFKDYDEHLVFESMNEPRLEGTSKEWWFATADPEGVDCIKKVCELNQLFVDTVRSAGGYNETRFLMVPSAIASPDNALNIAFSMPEDTIDNHLILSVHAYTPYDFTMNDNGYDTWSSAKEYEFDFIDKLCTKFKNNGYGVVIGEFGATNKNNLEDRVSWAHGYCNRAAKRGFACVLWDNGGTSVGNENFGMIDRKNLSIYYPEILDAMLEEYSK